MKCIICRQAEFENSSTSITLERDEFKVTIRNIPARVCPSCGEAVVDEETALCLLNMAEDVVNEGLLEDTREYVR